MNKTFKRAYIMPLCKPISTETEHCFLAGSPNAQPGGGGGGSIIVVPIGEDDEDTEISGAKGNRIWDGEE